MAVIQPSSLKAENFLDKKESKKGSEELQEEKYYEFYNLEEPGVALRFVYGSSKNPKKYTFFHGQKQKVSEEIANHVENCQTPIWKWRPGGDGIIGKKLLGWKPRFQMREVK